MRGGLDYLLTALTSIEYELDLTFVDHLCGMPCRIGGGSLSRIRATTTILFIVIMFTIFISSLRDLCLIIYSHSCVVPLFIRLCCFCF